MSIFAHVDGLGPRLEEAATDAILDWRRKHDPANRLADTMAEALTSVETSCTVFPKGRATVIVTVRGRRRWEDETHVFRLLRRTGGVWWRKSSTLNL